VKTGEHFAVFNVYAPCDSSRQQALWNNLSNRLSSLSDQNLCICDDFNAVRHVEERRSAGNNFCFQMAMSRGLSDHCPLVLSIDVENWGPKPMCLLKCWELLPGYKSFFRVKWRSFQVDGWGGFVLKEKLKLVKLALKEWHQRHTQNLPARISTLKDRIDALDLKGETTVLCDEEVDELHGFTEELFSLVRIKTSICWQ